MPEHKCHNEERLRSLEINEAGFRADIKNLITTMGNLTGWIKALTITFVGVFGAASLSAIGYLLVKWVESK